MLKKSHSLLDKTCHNSSHYHFQVLIYDLIARGFALNIYTIKRRIQKKIVLNFP